MTYRAGVVALTSILMSLVPLAQASAVTVIGSELPSGIALPIPNVTYTGSGPQTLAPGITWRSTDSHSYFGYYHNTTTTGYNFNANGYWNDINMAGLGSDVGRMTITFDTPVYGVGAFVNYSTGFAPPSVSVFDVSHVLIDTKVLSFVPDGGLNSGELIYFLVSSPEIASIEFARSYIGLTNIKYQDSPGPYVTATPLPAALPLFGGGLGLISLFGWWRGRSRRALH